jgi:hypothetical protein
VIYQHAAAGEFHIVAVRGDGQKVHGGGHGPNLRLSPDRRDSP